MDLLKQWWYFSYKEQPLEKDLWTTALQPYKTLQATKFKVRCSFAPALTLFSCFYSCLWNPTFFFSKYFLSSKKRCGGCKIWEQITAWYFELISERQRSSFQRFRAKRSNMSFQLSAWVFWGQSHCIQKFYSISCWWLGYEPKKIEFWTLWFLKENVTPLIRQITILSVFPVLINCNLEVLGFPKIRNWKYRRNSLLQAPFDSKLI